MIIKKNKPDRDTGDTENEIRRRQMADINKATESLSRIQQTTIIRSRSISR